MPSDAQHHHPIGQVVMQLETRSCSASVHVGRHLGYGSASIGRAPPPVEVSATVGQKKSAVPGTTSGFAFPASRQPTSEVNTAVSTGLVTSEF